MITKDFGFSHFLDKNGIKPWFFDKLPTVRKMALWAQYQEVKRERAKMIDEILTHLSP